jgi:lipoprotein-anchoring transpeptidase ErfK/SrfK
MHPHATILSVTVLALQNVLLFPCFNHRSIFAACSFLGFGAKFRSGICGILGESADTDHGASGRNPDMQPFARPQDRRVPLYWWLTGAGAVLFTIWALDLVPHIHTVPGGEVTGTNETTGPSVPPAALPGDWSDVSDSALASDEVRGDLRWSGLSEPAADESMSEGGGQSQSKEIVNARRRVVRDQMLRPAAYEAAADTPASEITGASEDSSSPDAYADASDEQGAILPADFGDSLQTIRGLIRSNQTLEAHAELSRLYWTYPTQRQTLKPFLEETAEKIFASAEHQFGEPHLVQYGETLEQIGREYEVPWQYLARLNGITPSKLQAGQQLKVVRGPFGAVVDLSAFTLTVHAHGWYVRDYRIGIGRDGKTPIGRFQIREKLENPVWYDPDGGVMEADDPENPLGEYWLGLGNHIGIHGTIDPASIGRAASRGCIHLADDDIRDVFELLCTGADVTVRK